MVGGWVWPKAIQCQILAESWWHWRYLPKGPEIMRKWIPISTTYCQNGFQSNQKDAKIIKIWTKWLYKSMTNQGCVADAFGERPWAEKGEWHPLFPGPIFEHKSIEIVRNTISKINKKRSPQNMKSDAKRIQNKAKTDAKTHQKSMPKLVSKKIRIIMTIHFCSDCVRGR